MDTQDFNSDVDKFIFITEYLRKQYSIGTQTLIDSIKSIDGSCDKFHEKIKEKQSKAEIRKLVDSYINKRESHE